MIARVVAGALMFALLYLVLFIVTAPDLAIETDWPEIPSAWRE